MSETWLRTNTRAIAFGMVLPAMIAVVGLLLAAGVGGYRQLWLRIAGSVLFVAGLAVIAGLGQQLRRPRLAYRDGELLVALRYGAPIGVPIAVVECFFLGQAPSMLPGRAEPVAARTLIVRLADAATDWSQRDVKPALGRWCGGYITIRGIWCEPLDVRLIQRLNHRLVEIKRTLARGATLD